MIHSSDGQLVVFHEWDGWNGIPNTGLRMGVREVAQKIKEYEKDLQISYGVADPSIWAKIANGPSIAETFTQEGIGFEPANNDRIMGKMEIHNRLRNDEYDRPQLMITENCKQLWRTLPMMQIDTRRPEDVDTKLEDHLYDCLRYVAMSKPTLAKAVESLYVGADTVTAEMDW